MEAANKNIKRILAKTLENYKDWVDYLQFALWGYQTATRTSTGVTLYSLVYMCEAILPVEVEISSLRVLLES